MYWLKISSVTARGVVVSFTYPHNLFNVVTPILSRVRIKILWERCSNFLLVIFDILSAFSIAEINNCMSCSVFIRTKLMICIMSAALGIADIMQYQGIIKKCLSSLEKRPTSTTELLSMVESVSRRRAVGLKAMLFFSSFTIVHINAPLAAARHNPSKLGFCSRLAQTLVFSGTIIIVRFKHMTIVWGNQYQRIP